MSDSSSVCTGGSGFFSSAERRPVTNWNKEGRAFSAGLTAGGITGGTGAAAGVDDGAGANKSSCAAAVFCGFG